MDTITIEVVFPDNTRQPGDVPASTTFAELKTTLLELYANRLQGPAESYDLLILPQNQDEKISRYGLKDGDVIVIAEKKRPPHFIPR